MANRRHVISAIVLAAATGMVAASGLSLPGKSHLSGGPYEGLVRDVEGRPVADALVLVKWMGTTPSMHSSRALCYYLALTRTRPDGRFHVPAWNVATPEKGRDPTWLRHVDPLHVEEMVYKSTYVDDIGRGRARDPMSIRLGPAAAAPDDRAEHLYELMGRSTCEGDSPKKALPWAKALAEEGRWLIGEDRSASLSTNARRQISALIFNEDFLTFGDDEARRRLGERMRTEKAGPK